MEINFLGGAKTVTGSMHLLKTDSGNILLDCGLYQGHRKESNERNKNLPINPNDVDIVILSHAHIDHSGALPSLIKKGYNGLIYSTPATRDLCSVMLRDAAYIQKQDAQYLNSYNKRHGIDETVEPIYSEDDVIETMSRFVTISYGRKINVLPSVTCTFLDAGHVLGSAIIQLDIKNKNNQNIRFVFSGDLGRLNMPILNDPQKPDEIDYLIMESTYGDRIHDNIEEMDSKLGEVINKTSKRGGKIIIPSFSLERTQEIVLALHRLYEKGTIKPIPIYVDSPLTVKVTEVFKLHPECFDDQLREFMKQNQDPFGFETLRYITNVNDSMALNDMQNPSVIISASGMCEAGRILHHLKNNIENPKNTICIVGFQAEHTLGRRLVEQRSKVKIFGIERNLNADVVIFNGFSAHADQKELLNFAKSSYENGKKLKKIFLVHGEPKQSETLKDLIKQNKLPEAIIPDQGQKYKLI